MVDLVVRLPLMARYSPTHGYEYQCSLWLFDQNLVLVFMAREKFMDKFAGYFNVIFIENRRRLFIRVQSKIENLITLIIRNLITK